MKPLFVMLAVLPFLSACNQPESPNAELFPAAGAENVNCLLYTSDAADEL